MIKNSPAQSCKENRLARIIEIRHPKTCPPSLHLGVGDLLVFSATGGHIRDGAEFVKFLGAYFTAALAPDGNIVSPAGTPNHAIFLTQAPGNAVIDVVTGDPWRAFDMTKLTLTIMA
jgi:hypothetical protein